MAEPGAGPALSFSGVTKSFGRGSRSVAALRNLTLAVPAARITGLFGPDAAGKTTLLRLAAGLLSPDQGRLEVLGHDVVQRHGADSEPHRLHAAAVRPLRRPDGA